jgi:hypothetical protein
MEGGKGDVQDLPDKDHKSLVEIIQPQGDKNTTPVENIDEDAIYHPTDGGIEDVQDLPDKDPKSNVEIFNHRGTQRPSKILTRTQVTNQRRGV